MQNRKSSLKVNFPGILLLLVLLLLAWASARPIRLPSAAPAGAQAAALSVERAVSDLKVIAREPHPARSEAQAKVRDFIVAQVAAVGLNAEVQKGNGVENVIVRMPGTHPTRVLLVTGHYDSHPPAPGGGDDGVSVAAMLETLRALRAGPALQNDAIYLFTDGEELGWLGAIEFINQHPLAKQVGVVLVFDARPGNAPLMLTQTSAGDGWLVKQLSGLPLPIWAGSWTNLEERGDADTDFTVFDRTGFFGIEFENAAAGTHYHTIYDTASAITPRTLRDYSETMLQLTRRFGALDLSAPTKEKDMDFFSAPAVGLVVYPSWLTPAAGALAVILLIVVIGIAWRQRRLSLARTLVGVGVFLAALVVVTLLASLVWGQVINAHAAEARLLEKPDFEGSLPWVTGLMLGSGTLILVLVYLMSRRIGSISLTVGGQLTFILIWAVVYFALKTSNPFTTPYLAMPFLSSVIALAGVTFIRSRFWVALVLAMASVPELVLFEPQLVRSVNTPGDGAWVSVLSFGLLICVLIPQFLLITDRLDAGTKA